MEVPVALAISRRRGSLMWASALGLAGLAVGAIVAWAARPAPVARETTRSLVSAAPTEQPVGVNPLEQRVERPRPTRTSLSLSPDGKTLVFGAIWSGVQQLDARAMNQLSATRRASRDRRDDKPYWGFLEVHINARSKPLPVRQQTALRGSDHASAAPRAVGGEHPDPAGSASDRRARLAGARLMAGA